MPLFSFQRQKCICVCSPTTLKGANTTPPSAVIFFPMSDPSIHKNLCVAWSKTKPRLTSIFHPQACALGCIKPVTLTSGTLRSLAVNFSSWYHFFFHPLPSNTKQSAGMCKAGELFSTLSATGVNITLPHLKTPEVRHWPGSSTWHCHGMSQCSPSAPSLQAGAGYPMG